MTLTCPSTTEGSNITWAQAQEDCGWLGLIKTVHSLGRYDFVEYKNEKDGKTYFGGFIDGKGCNESWHSLDEAMIGVVARRVDGLNSRAAKYFFRMIGIEGFEA